MLKLVIATLCMTIGGIHHGASALDERVVGGSTAPDGAYPYQVSLRLQNTHFCGASIISSYWILTAAHCIQGNSPQNILAVVGTNYLDRGGYAYRVSQLITHEYYNNQNLAHDIGLLRVRTAISFTNKIQPIGLASNTARDGLSCILTGWGSTTMSGDSPPAISLQRISMNTISQSQCASAMPKGYQIYSSHVCTNRGRGYGACMGDSGGPLVSGRQQVGVVSWGIPCAQGYPDVFTSVAYYRSWISQKSGV